MSDPMYEALVPELKLAEYAELTDEAALARLLTKTVTRVIPAPVMKNERSILSVFANPADGEAFLQKVEAVAQANPLLKRVVKWMAPSEEGIDFSLPATRAMLDTLPAMTAGTPAEITAAEIATVKSLGEETILWTQAAGVTPQLGNVQSARAMIAEEANNGN